MLYRPATGRLPRVVPSPGRPGKRSVEPERKRPDMLGIGVQVLAFVLVSVLWLVGEAEFRTKVILTGLYLASWLLIFAGGLLLVAAQGLLAVILWYASFGLNPRR